MTAADIERLERLALAQTGKEMGTAIAVTPGQLLALCRLARQAIGEAA